jgi:hypothetical protein
MGRAMEGIGCVMLIVVIAVSAWAVANGIASWMEVLR